jgi:hypothetical protein
MTNHDHFALIADASTMAPIPLVLDPAAELRPDGFRHLTALAELADGPAVAGVLSRTPEADYPTALLALLSTWGQERSAMLGFQSSPDEARALARDLDGHAPLTAPGASTWSFTLAVEAALALCSIAASKTDIAIGLVSAMAKAASPMLAYEACRWLAQMFPPTARIGLVSMAPDAGPTGGCQGDPHDPNTAVRMQSFIAGALLRGENIYYHTNPVLAGFHGTKAKDTDIAERLHALLDFDLKSFARDDGLDATRSRLDAAVEQAKEQIGVAPKAEIMSGGGVQLVFAASPELDKNDWGGVCAALGSDPVQDVSRLARLPLTFNVPNLKKRAAGRGITLAYPFHQPNQGAGRVDVAWIKALSATAPERQPRSDRSKAQVEGVVVTSNAPQAPNVTDEDRQRLDAMWPQICQAKSLDDLPEPMGGNIRFRLVSDRLLNARFSGDTEPFVDRSGVLRASGFAAGDKSSATFSLITIARHAGWPIEETAALSVCHAHGELQPGGKYARDEERKRQFLRSWSKAARETPPLKDTHGSATRKRSSGPTLRAAEQALLNMPGVELWRAAESGEKCITLPRTAGGLRHFSLSSQGCREAVFGLLRGLPDEQAQVPLKAVEDLTRELAALASDTPEHPCGLRSASYAGAIYINMGDDLGRVIEVDANGWRLIQAEKSPVRFLRSGTLLPLPEPISSVDGLMQLLRAHISLPTRSTGDKDDPAVRGEAALLTYLSAAVRREGALPHLALSGPAGAGKTTTARRLKGLFDPDATMETGAPRDVASLVAVARAQSIPVLDNLSRIGPDLSDALCGLATGTALASRKLYTDGDLFAARVRSGAIITSVVPGLADRSDLLSRILRLTLERRRIHTPETALNTAWVTAHPAMLAGFLDALSAGLRNLPHVQADLAGKDLPRLSDAAIFAESVARGLGWTNNLLIDTLRASEADAQTDAAVDDPLVGSMIAVAQAAGGSWQGRMANLLEACKLKNGRFGGIDKMSARGLSAAISRLDRDALTRLGLRISSPRKHEVLLEYVDPFGAPPLPGYPF